MLRPTTRVVSALLAVSMTAVMLSASPAGAETDGSAVVPESSAGADALHPARTTTANAIVRPDFAVTPCPELTDSVLRLYSAYFLRAPDEEGFDFWTLENSAGNWSMPRMSAFFASSDEFNDLYGTLSDAQFINLIYNNILGRNADDEGSAYWLNRMTNEGLDRGTVMLFFSESPEYIDLTETVTPLAGEFAWYPEGTNWNCGFGATELAIPDNSFVDIVTYNDSDRAIEVAIREGANGSFNPRFNVPVNPKGYYVFFGRPSANTGVTAVELTSADEFFWIVVFSPVQTPTVREGWVAL